MNKFKRPSDRALTAICAAIGQRLRSERKRLGLTQVELGDAFAVTRDTIIHYEAGDRSPTAEQLHMLDRLGGDSQFVVTGQASLRTTTAG